MAPDHSHEDASQRVRSSLSENRPLRKTEIVTDARREPQALQLVSRDNRRAGDHPEVDVDDRVNWEHGVDEDDVVWNCVFLPDADHRVSEPKKTYAFPESVLARYPVEAAEPATARLHTEVLVDFLAGLLVEADERGTGEEVRGAIIGAHDRTKALEPTEQLLEFAEELAAAETFATSGFGEDDPA